MKIGIISGASSGIGRAIVKEIDSLGIYGDIRTGICLKNGDPGKFCVIDVKWQYKY